MDSAKTTRAGARPRRKIFSCPVCDEVFIDEESLKRHELTHQNQEGGAGEAAEPPAEAAAPEPSPAQAEAAAVPVATAEPPRRSLSSVRRQAQASEESEAALPAHLAPSALETEEVGRIDEGVSLTAAPLAAEALPSSIGRGMWAFLEDFSEWFVTGGSHTAGMLGSSVVSGAGLALRALILLSLAAACVFAGSWLGRTYGPQLWPGSSQPLVPPRRTVSLQATDLSAVRDLVTDFYRNISKKQYSQAYALLSSDWQKQISLGAFQSGYAHTESASLTLESIRALSNGRYEVDIQLKVKERGQVFRYQGRYLAVMTAHGWRLDQGDLR